jgi:hypothetical protein
MWKEDNCRFEVESWLFNNGLNIITFQPIMGEKQFYVIGVYIPPNCTRGVEDLRRAGEACLVGCKLVVMRDLNINFGFPWDNQEEVIVNLLDETNSVYPLHGFGTATRARWTWSQK